MITTLKKTKILIIAIFIFSLKTSLFAQLPEKWPHKEVSFTIENKNIHIPYWSNSSLINTDNTKKRAVIAIHGINQWSKVIMERISKAAEEEGVLDETIIICPVFIEKNDFEHYSLDNKYPYWTSRWKYGDLSQNKNNRVSSYAIIDEILKMLIANNPNLKSIVVTGFSAGGQFANRYAAGGRGPWLISGKTDIRFIVHAPSSYLYFNKKRLSANNTFEVSKDTSCNYNNYPYGLDDNLNNYMETTGVKQIRKNYKKRTILHMVGAQDTAKKYLDVSCKAMLQGRNRAERGVVYLRYLQYYYGKKILKTKSVAIVDGYAHSSKAYLSKESKKFMFPKL